MTPARWQQVKDVVGDALERADTAERAAFLAHACSEDTALLHEAESLLAAASSDNLQACADELRISQTELIDAALGRRIGAYEVVRELGRGGMGAVYLARRADQEFKKQVAIKLLKRGMDTDEVLRRFRAEREILARLEHPNIGRLLDGGTTEDGLPYFVMEFVRGSRVTDFVWANNLPLKERLQLFLKICGAVQFAHQNLVVHRDLKPSNILVTAEGEPKLLDFGIAKLLAPGEDAWEVTIAGRERLTPGYASPEQVRGEPVTTVSDVYTLGALLYEILTERPPHRFGGSNPTATEIQRVVCSEEPVRPSLAVLKPELRRQLRGDLDTIIMRALSKLPERRYSSAATLAHDIRRYIEGRPVRARRDTAGYRARKFLGRNKPAVAAAALLFVALLAGSATTLWQARRAERRFNDVRKLANSFLFEFHDAIAALPGATAARQLIVTRALEYLDKLAREAAGQRSLELELAEAYLKVGDVQGKPYTANLGDSAGAIRSYTRATEIAAACAAQEMGGTETRARSAMIRGYLSLAAVQARMNQREEAAENNRRALAIGEKLLIDAPQRGDEWRRLIVSCHWGLGDAIQAGNHQRRDPDLHRASLEHYRRALPLAEQLAAANPGSTDDVRRLAKACSRAAIGVELGVTTGETAYFDEALPLHARAVALLGGLVEQNPADAQLRRSLADALITKAAACTLAERELGTAYAEATRGLAIQRELAAADPSNAEAQQDLAYAHYTTARICQLRGDFGKAAEHYNSSLVILEPLVSRQSDNVETAFDLERTRRGLAEVKGR
ncbi:MAG: protein kinase [Chthoniobacterales bacterium]